MANQEHLDLLNQGVETWNASNRTLGWWRADLSNADLSGRNLSKIDFFGAYLRGTNLDGADLQDADLVGADLSEASLRRTNFSHADLTNADLSRADLTGAHLTKATLIRAKAFNANLGAVLAETILCWADLSGANFRNAEFGATILGDTNLSRAQNLESCSHLLPSIIDHKTLMKSGELPSSFLRGCGLPDSIIDFLPSLLAPLQSYSCFICYSHRDRAFAEILRTDLSKAGLRCWYAEQTLSLGESLMERVLDAMTASDKVIVILSAAAIKSPGVIIEASVALKREYGQPRQVVFPIRLDDEAMNPHFPLSMELVNRYIGDFSDWKDRHSYQKALSRLIRDLTFSITPATHK